MVFSITVFIGDENGDEKNIKCRYLVYSPNVR